MAAFDSLVERATGYVDLGMWREASELIDSLPVEQKRDRALLPVRLAIYRESGQWELLGEVAQHLVMLEPGIPHYWLHLAAATRNVESIPAARDVLVKAARQFPGDGQTLFALAYHEAELGEEDVARLHLAEAIRLDPRLKSYAEADVEVSWLLD